LCSGIVTGMANTDMSDSPGSGAPSREPVLPNSPMPGSRSIVVALVGIGALIVVLASFALTRSPEPELSQSPVSVSIAPSGTHAIPANNDDDRDDGEPPLPAPTSGNTDPAPPPSTGAPQPGPPAPPAAPAPPPAGDPDDDLDDDDLDDDDLDDDDLDDD